MDRLRRPPHRQGPLRAAVTTLRARGVSKKTRRRLASLSTSSNVTSSRVGPRADDVQDTILLEAIYGHDVRITIGFARSSCAGAATSASSLRFATVDAPRVEAGE